MATAFSLPAPGLHAFDLAAANKTLPPSPTDAAKAKAKTAAQNFEAVFLNSMFEQMYTGVDGDGPFGGNGATGVWRSFLTDEYAKTIAKAGGIGIATQVYKTLIAAQEAHR